MQEKQFKEATGITCTMHQLRDKIKECGGDDVIVTVRGIGYRFDVK
jgi:DNA-binding response OmpR family regulator